MASFAGFVGDRRNALLRAVAQTIDNARLTDAGLSDDDCAAVADERPDCGNSCSFAGAALRDIVTNALNFGVSFGF